MNLLTRDQWGAEYDVSGRAMMTGLPVDLMFIHHTVTNPTSDPAADMRGIERIDISRFGVPSYSYVIHPSGTVLEGMGLHRGAHTINNANHSFNDDAFGVSFIGNFENDTPTPEAFNACVDLLRSLVDQGHAHADFTFSGHRDVYATACPGENLYPLIGSIRESVNSPHPAPTPTPDNPEDETVQLIYVVKKGTDGKPTGPVYLSSQLAARQVSAFADEEYVAGVLGNKILTPPKGTTAPVTDGAKQTRDVFLVDNLAAFGVR